jgi:hypothetical protein
MRVEIVIERIEQILHMHARVDVPFNTELAPEK